MYMQIGEVVERIFPRRRPYVSILVAIPLNLSIDRCQQTIAAEIKFPLVNQQRVINVLLQNVGPLRIARPSPNNLLHFAKRASKLDSNASIGVFTRFYNPSVLRGSVSASYLLNGFLFFFGLLLRAILILHSFLLFSLRLYFIPILFQSFFCGLFRSFRRLFKHVERLNKAGIFGILCSFGSVESQWQNLERILIERLVVEAHIDINALFIGQLLILFHTIVQFDGKLDFVARTRHGRFLFKHRFSKVKAASTL